MSESYFRTSVASRLASLFFSLKQLSVFGIQIFGCKVIFYRVEVVSTEICQEEGEDNDESLAGR